MPVYVPVAPPFRVFAVTLHPDPMLQKYTGATTPLVYALRNDDIPTIRLLLADSRVKVDSLVVRPVKWGTGDASYPALCLGHGSLLQVEGDKDWSALHYAARSNGDVAIALLLADPRTALINHAPGSLSLETPLHVAAKHGHAAAVRALLADPRVDVNAVGGLHRWTPLETARATAEDRASRHLRKFPAPRTEDFEGVIAALEADPRVTR